MWWTSALSYVLLFLLIFGISGTVDLTSFRSRLSDFRSILVGVGCQFVFLPLLGFAVVKLLDLPALYGLVLLVTVSSPGGSYSNWWCALCNADLALSVAMTTISTIASVGLLPLNMLVYVQATYGRSVEIAWLNIGISILVVISAIFSGLYMGLKAPGQRQRLNTLGNLCGVALIVMGLAFNSSSPVPLWDHTPLFYVAVALPCILGMLLSFCMSIALGINKPSAVAITIEVCYQNTGIALTVALSTFEGDDASIAAGVPLFYSAVQLVLIALFALVSWRLGWTYSPPSESVAKCIGGNYQPLDVEPRVHVEAAPVSAPPAVADEEPRLGGRRGTGAIQRSSTVETLTDVLVPQLHMSPQAPQSPGGTSMQLRPGETGGSAVFEAQDDATGSPIVVVQEWRQYTTVQSSPFSAPEGRPLATETEAPVPQPAGATDSLAFLRSAMQQIRVPTLGQRSSLPPIMPVPTGAPGTEASAPAAASTPALSAPGRLSSKSQLVATTQHVVSSVSFFNASSAADWNLLRRLRGASSAVAPSAPAEPNSISELGQTPPAQTPTPSARASDVEMGRGFEAAAAQIAAVADDPAGATGAGLPPSPREGVVLHQSPGESVLPSGSNETSHTADLPPIAPAVRPQVPEIPSEALGEILPQSRRGSTSDTQNTDSPPAQRPTPRVDGASAGEGELARMAAGALARGEATPSPPHADADRLQVGQATGEPMYRNPGLHDADSAEADTSTAQGTTRSAEHPPPSGALAAPEGPVSTVRAPSGSYDAEI
mmetsp:Transcript_13934/g.37431  ORF Transcript_13934/g.37431 Transcript_13934/m.37431 type:complete len:773 (-) Transcript_13934:1507-3825(-)